MPSSRQRRAEVLVVVGLAATAVLAQAPSWWTSRAVLLTGPGVVTNDFSLVNQGQVKWMATQAKAEFDEKLQLIGGAGSNVNALVGSFVNANNYRPVNAGMLKNTVAPFYERLLALGLTNCYPAGAGRPYPWSNSTNPPRDFSIVNIGQTKYVYSFNTEVDSDGDGIPDMWERSLGSDPYLHDAQAVNTNAWAQGLTNLELYQGMSSLTIPNAWAVYTNTSQVAVVADIRSRNRYLTVKAAEFFLDTTNGVTFGTGTAMSAMDGAFNSTNEMAQAIFTPTFPAGERHEIFIHAQDNANHWCPFVKVIVNPNINDILDRIQANYSAIHDLQFKVVFTETKDGVMTRSDIVAVKMKGPYKTRSEYSTGLCVIQNENTEWWFKPSLGGHAMQTALNDDFDPNANRNADIFWDIPLWRSRMTSSIAGAPTPGIFDVAMSPTGGSIWQPQTMRVDFSRGFVTQLNINDTDISASINYSNPLEVAPGVWLFTSHHHVLQFSGGFQMITDFILTDIKVNQGLNDSLFTIPTE